ncbi:MAG: hypothetical protein QW594_04245, partial [Candidatus Woesearchaeota archaeon]
NPYGPMGYRTEIKIIDGNHTATIFNYTGYLLDELVVGDLGQQTPSLIVGIHSPALTTSDRNKVVAFDFYRNQLFNISLPHYEYSITHLRVGDLDNDGVQEIIVVHSPVYFMKETGILIYSSQGVLLKHIPLFTSGHSERVVSSAITDFDNDGKTDIILYTNYEARSPTTYFYDLDPNIFQRIYVFNLGTTMGRLDWPMEYHDMQHTSRYDTARIPRLLAPINLTARLIGTK